MNCRLLTIVFLNNLDEFSIKKINCKLQYCSENKYEINIIGLLSIKLLNPLTAAKKSPLQKKLILVIAWDLIRITTEFPFLFTCNLNSVPYDYCFSSSDRAVKIKLFKFMYNNIFVRILKFNPVHWR